MLHATAQVRTSEAPPLCGWLNLYAANPNLLYQVRTSEAALRRAVESLDTTRDPHKAQRALTEARAALSQLYQDDGSASLSLKLLLSYTRSSE